MTKETAITAPAVSSLGPPRTEWPRLTAVSRALAPLDLLRLDAPLGDEADMLRCHPAAYMTRVKAAVPRQNWASMDGDTYLAPGVSIGRPCAVWVGPVQRWIWCCLARCRMPLSPPARRAAMQRPPPPWGFACLARGDCRQARAGGASACPRCDCRFRRASRQWHPGSAVE